MADTAQIRKYLSTEVQKLERTGQKPQTRVIQELRKDNGKCNAVRIQEIPNALHQNRSNASTSISCTKKISLLHASENIEAHFKCGTKTDFKNDDALRQIQCKI